MRVLLLFACLNLCADSFCQKKSYTDSLIDYKRNYIGTHEVVKSKDRKYFRFYPINKKYAITARFEKSNDTSLVPMKTTGTEIPVKDFYRYGKIYFMLDGKERELTLFQSKMLMNNSQYKNYLFLPFTDSTTGVDTYGSGRYIDVQTTEIRNGLLILDFNKAYNPYCAYSTGFNCPIPPKENRLNIFIKAGEKNFAKPH